MDLDRRMRRGEAYHGLRVPEGCWTVARVDGRGFSRLTAARFERPFDRRFHELMVQAAIRLVRELDAVYGYTESDEVSVLLPPSFQLFDREVEKLVSLTASMAASTFSVGLGEPVQFDSRLWVSGSAEDVVDYFRWRQSDAARCALNGWCYWKLRQAGRTVKEATAALRGLGVSEKNELLHKHGVNFNDVPAWQKRGVGLRWERWVKQGRDPRRDEPVEAVRRRLAVVEDLPLKAAYSDFVREILDTA